MTVTRSICPPTRFALAIALSIVVIASSAVAQSTPFERAMESGRYDQALRIAENAVRQRPTDAVAAFDLACALARTGDADRAIEALLESARLGFGGIRTIEGDDDLDSLRPHPRFPEVVAAVQRNVDARFERFRNAARDSEPTILIPPGHDPRVPTTLIVMLHGTGGTGQSIARAWREPAASLGAIVLAPDALRPARGGRGFSWTFRDEAEWYVLHVIDAIRAEHAIDHVILAGFSQGANIALMLGQTHPERFDGVLPICGHYEPDVADVPTHGRRPAWFLLTGERDPARATYVAAERAFSAAGMHVRRETMARTGHAMPSGARGERMLSTAIRDLLRHAPAVTADGDEAPPAGENSERNADQDRDSHDRDGGQ